MKIKKMALHTDGSGYWSQAKQAVTISELSLNYFSLEDDVGELIAHFPKSSWDTNKNGLIYTDDLWIKEFRDELCKSYGISREEAEDIRYSEQGMQGNDYVSMDVGEVFLGSESDLIKNLMGDYMHVLSTKGSK